MNQVGYDAQELRTLLAPMVAMIVETIRPVQNILTVNQAYEKYGRRWIDDQIREGNLSFSTHGKRLTLSRADIECLLAAEKRQPKIEFK